MTVTVLRDRRVAFLVPLSPRELRAALAAMLAACGREELPLELCLVDDARIASYNSRFLHCPGPTNVLSFPASPRASGSDDRNAAASLMLSVETLRRECLLYGQAPAEHLLRLLAHGLVHLLGFDHGAAMETLCGKAEKAGRTALAGEQQRVSAGPT